MIAPFSVLMSVYAKERPEFLHESLTSLMNSSVFPTEVVLVEDGPISEALQLVIARARVTLNIVSVPLPHNIGLPGALNAGLRACHYELVARFDTDDICMPERFERQLAFMLEHPEIAALGTVIQEFDPATGKRLSLRAPPSNHAALVRYASLSSPLNHPSVMFRRSAVLAVGAYPEHMKVAYEDYALWLNLVLAGYELANLPQVMVHMRAGAGQVERRRGLRYARQEAAFAKHFHRAGFLNIWQYFRFLLFRLPVRFLPEKLIGIIYGFLVRTRM